MIRTREFSIAPSATASHLAQQWLWKRWFLFALPAAVLLVMGIFDLRWLIVAMMYVFILWPFALFFVWCNAALTPEAVKASRPRCIVFDENGMSVEYTMVDGYATPAGEVIGWQSVEEVEQGSKYLVFRCAAGAPVRVPIGSIDNQQVAEILMMYRRAKLP